MVLQTANLMEPYEVQWDLRVLEAEALGVGTRVRLIGGGHGCVEACEDKCNYSVCGSVNRASLTGCLVSVCIRIPHGEQRSTEIARWNDIRVIKAGRAQHLTTIEGHDEEVANYQYYAAPCHVLLCAPSFVLPFRCDCEATWCATDNATCVTIGCTQCTTDGPTITEIHIFLSLLSGSFRIAWSCAQSLSRGGRGGLACVEGGGTLPAWLPLASFIPYIYIYIYIY